ncbi:MAG: mechanosensitive ion channel [Thiotrichales bacterium]|nr:mechanosensitive ion channel [Thiotrichales bacterium]
MLDSHLLQLGLSTLSVAAFFVVTQIITKVMAKLGAFKEVDDARRIYIQQFFKVIAFFGLLMILTAIWGVDYHGLFLFASSILAVLGVALFAQWSLLSNITSSVILFFSFPARIGDKIEIIDGANIITGTITEINIFQMLLRDDKGFEISYPNNLILQRPVRKLASSSAQSKGAKTSPLKTRIKNRS